jgi:hypothetical protein
VSSSSPFAGAIDLSKIGGQQAPAADDVTKGVDDKSKVSAMLDGSYKGSAKGVHKH